MDKLLEPVCLGIAIIFNFIPRLCSADDSAQRDERMDSRLCLCVRRTLGSLIEEKNAMGVLGVVI